jgi:glycosyltransferase involved in cell wall biosynthesis
VYLSGVAMRIHILYPFKEGPWGGGNQFLKAIKLYIEKQGYYENNPKKADVIIFNGNPSVLRLFVNKLYKLKKNNPNILIFIRLDGPIFLYRGCDFEIDKIFYKLNSATADGMIFQSNWSKQKNILQGMTRNLFELTVFNAPNSSVFNAGGRKPFQDKKRVCLVATSWSNNPNKGFSVYKWLDKNLDFTRYKMIFIGNTPVKFKNILHIPPLDSQKLAVELKNSDIFITASQKDPCSNSLIEALHCGIPSIALNDGGHSELLGRGGEVFDHAVEIPAILEKIVFNYSTYKSNIQVPSIDQVGATYLKFIEGVFFKFKQGLYVPKIFHWTDFLKIKKLFYFWLIKKKITLLKIKIGLKFNCNPPKN